MTDAARIARVRCVVAAAARIAEPLDPLGQEARARLPAASGLSPEGVELALATCLERRATADDLAALVGHAGGAARCWVVASANVCTAAARAIALGLAAAPDVRVRPSRRDPVVAELIVRALAADPALAAAGGRALLVDALDAAPGDEVHAYGSDATMATLAAALPLGATLRGHGTGLGVAAVAAGDDPAWAAEAIAADVAVLDQRGCLSPRVVLVEGGAGRAAALAARLDRALARWGALVPRGPLDAATAEELARWTATMSAVGDVASGSDHVVAHVGEATALAVGPPARAVLVMGAGDDARALLAPVARWIAAFGRDDPASPLARSIGAFAPAARPSRLGQMQRPPLDGPVDRRRADFHGAPRLV